MAILKSKDGKDLLVDCCCGCHSGVRFSIDKDDYDWYCIVAYTNGKFYSEQGETAWQVFKKKIKKIWSILRNKDFYYADICLNKEDFEEFKQYINSIE